MGCQGAIEAVNLLDVDCETFLTFTDAQAMAFRKFTIQQPDAQELIRSAFADDEVTWVLICGRSVVYEVKKEGKPLCPVEILTYAEESGKAPVIITRDDASHLGII